MPNCADGPLARLHALLHAGCADRFLAELHGLLHADRADGSVAVLRGVALRAVLPVLLCGGAAADRAHNAVDHADPRLLTLDFPLNALPPGPIIRRSNVRTGRRPMPDTADDFVMKHKRPV